MSRNPRLQDLQWRLEYGVLRTVAAFFRSLPLSFATSASAFAWRRLAPIINPKRHKRALDNLAIAFPEKSDADTTAIRALNDKVAADERVSVSLLPLGDGLTLARKR